MKPRNTYVSGLRAALAYAEKRAEACRVEGDGHAAGNPHFTDEQNAMWVKIERQCFFEADHIAGEIRRMIESAPRDLKEPQS